MKGRKEGRKKGRKEGRKEGRVKIKSASFADSL
jgi:flagellar biosynthesis/type III secretory pathway protein FliH